MISFSSFLLTENFGNLAVMPGKLAQIVINMHSHPGPGSDVVRVDSPTSAKIRPLLKGFDTLIWMSQHSPLHALKRTSSTLPVVRVVNIYQYSGSGKYSIRTIDLRDLTVMAPNTPNSDTLKGICEGVDVMWVVSADPARATKRTEREKNQAFVSPFSMVDDDDMYKHVFEVKRMQILRKWVALIKKIIDTYGFGYSTQLRKVEKVIDMTPFTRYLPKFDTIHPNARRELLRDLPIFNRLIDEHMAQVASQSGPTFIPIPSHGKSVQSLYKDLDEALKNAEQYAFRFWY